MTNTFCISSYSQIELRVIASMSNDKSILMHLIMMKIFIPQQLQMFLELNLRMLHRTRSHAKVAKLWNYLWCFFWIGNQTKLSRSESKK